MNSKDMYRLRASMCIHGILFCTEIVVVPVWNLYEIIARADTNWASVNEPHTRATFSRSRAHKNTPEEEERV